MVLVQDMMVLEQDRLVLVQDIFPHQTCMYTVFASPKQIKHVSNKETCNSIPISPLRGRDWYCSLAGFARCSLRSRLIAVERVKGTIQKAGGFHLSAEVSSALSHKGRTVHTVVWLGQKPLRSATLSRPTSFPSQRQSRYASKQTQIFERRQRSSDSTVTNLFSQTKSFVDFPKINSGHISGYSKPACFRCHAAGPFILSFGAPGPELYSLFFKVSITTLEFLSFGTIPFFLMALFARKADLSYTAETMKSKLPIKPSPKTIAAMQEARSGGLRRFETIAAFMADLNSNANIIPLDEVFFKRLDELTGDVEVDLNAPLHSDDSDIS